MCLIKNNVAGLAGGAVHIVGGRAEFDFCYLSNNTAAKGGAFLISGVSATLIFNSILSNKI